ncbi:MAG: hypothetical protein N3E51_01670 [Candidatus Micrarchaeota archaeon]|nr:hypothetical protein [Candidatus Micrarchaeota archaeon]
MASDKTRALIAFAKIAVSLAAGYGIAYVWAEAREGIDEWFVPYLAGLVAALMVFVLLSKLNKGAD